MPRKVTLRIERHYIDTAYLKLAVPDDWTDRQAREWYGKNERHSHIVGLLTFDEDYEEEGGPDDVETVEDGDYAPDLTVNADGTFEEYVEPYAEPEEKHWIEWRGHKWATDGSYLMRDDGPRPAQWVGWFERSRAPELEPVVAGSTFTVVRFVGTIENGDGDSIRVYCHADGRAFCLMSEYAAGWDDLVVAVDNGRHFAVAKRGDESVALLAKYNEHHDATAEERVRALLAKQ